MEPSAWDIQRGLAFTMTCDDRMIVVEDTRLLEGCRWWSWPEPGPKLPTPRTPRIPCQFNLSGNRGGENRAELFDLC